MTTYTDTQLKQALAKMLPEKVTYIHERVLNELHWNPVNWHGSSATVLDTELLHLCWLVESTLDEKIHSDYQTSLVGTHPKRKPFVSMPWQQRVIALAKVKGVEIV